jgi:Cysteine rich repeat
MKQLIVLIIALLVPAAAIAKGECKEDRQKFCKDVIKSNGDILACMKQHEAELSETCKAAREAKAKAKEAEENPTTGNEPPKPTSP